MYDTDVDFAENKHALSREGEKGEKKVRKNMMPITLTLTLCCTAEMKSLSTSQVSTTTGRLTPLSIRLWVKKEKEKTGQRTSPSAE